eukprot:CAMPEP_0172460086 /NCGR_PEP_ID=MMETSP1065-20121228/35455_1 /TAXON_ID=265537 /ORGANISM="Amphiprora paludosa, Strain CCMP125" /LENGTH=297 /DNA_ID=CAMNT_0013215009 /DNA_START=232 /DNA_END=1125 /DNA_ORIENTATION=-
MAGWLLALFQDGCDYVRVTGPIVAEIATQPNAPYLEAGRNAYREPYYNARSDTWETEYIGNCLVYPENSVNIDVYWNVSKGFDFIAIVLGGTGTLFLWFSACCIFSRGTWRLAGFQVLMAAVFQAASFLWFKTDLCNGGSEDTTDNQVEGVNSTNECELFWGSWSDIASVISWTLAAVFIFCHYPVPVDHVARLLEEQQHQQQQQQDYDDGTGGPDGIIAVTGVMTEPPQLGGDALPYTDNAFAEGEGFDISEKEDEGQDNHWLADSSSSSPTSGAPGGQDSGEGSGEEGGTTAQIV